MFRSDLHGDLLHRLDNLHLRHLNPRIFPDVAVLLVNADQRCRGVRLQDILRDMLPFLKNQLGLDNILDNFLNLLNSNKPNTILFFKTSSGTFHMVMRRL